MGSVLHIRKFRTLQAAPGHLPQGHRSDGPRPIRNYLHHLEPVRRLRLKGRRFPDRMGWQMERVVRTLRVQARLAREGLRRAWEGFGDRAAVAASGSP